MRGDRTHSAAKLVVTIFVLIFAPVAIFAELKMTIYATFHPDFWVLLYLLGR